MGESTRSPNQTDVEEFGARLRHYREAAGLSGRELARRVEISAQKLNDLELGRVKKLPPFDEMMRIAHALDVDVLELAGRNLPGVQQPRSLHSCSAVDSRQNTPVRVRHLEQPPATKHANGLVVDKQEAEEYRVYLPPGAGKEDRFFSITMGDDRMEPLIQLGDTIVVDMEPTVEPGKIVVVTIDGERVAVRWIMDLNGLRVLKPERGASVIVDESVVLHGVVIQIVRDAP